MEVRCGKCNKLFRVSDDKITGSGIKFACSKCGEYVKITQEDFEQYKLSQETAAALASFVPKPKTKPGAAIPAGAEIETTPSPAASVLGFDLGEPPQTETPQPAAVASQAPAASVLDFDLSEPSHAEVPQGEETSPAFAPPTPLREPAQEPPVAQPKPEPVAEPKAAPKAGPKKPTVEPKVAPKAEPKAAAPAAPQQKTPKPAAISRPAESPKPEAITIPSTTHAESAEEAVQAAAEERPRASAADASSQSGKRLGIFVAALLAVVIAAVFIARSYFGGTSAPPEKPAQTMTTAEGLRITNPSGAIDPVTQDLVITGVIENSTDTQRPAWLVVAEVYDAQNNVLIKEKLLNGKQLYTKRDFDLLLKRGQNIEEIKKKMQEQGTILPPKGTANFEIRIMDAPPGIASFNITPQPFDPVQLFKEIAEDQKQQ